MGTVPARIHYHLVYRMAKEIKSKVSNLSTDPDTIKNLAEDDATAKARENLKERRECLRLSLDKLKDY